MGGEKDNGSKSRQTTSRYEGSLQQGTGVYQTRAMPHGRKGQDQIYALRPGNSSLVRRGKSPYPLPYVQTSSEKIWTFSHQEGSIRRLVRTRTPSAMEDTPSDPRQPPDTLYGDGVPRTKLH